MYSYIVEFTFEVKLMFVGFFCFQSYSEMLGVIFKQRFWDHVVSEIKPESWGWSGSTEGRVFGMYIDDLGSNPEPI